MSAPYHADNSSLLRAANRLAIVDVHSGLGPEGRDTLMASTDEMAVELGKHFKGGVAGITELDSVSIQGMSGPQGGAQGGAAEGYDLTVGDMIPCYTGHHSKARQGLPEAEMSIGFCQEFGTRAPVFVALSLVFENMAHHFGTPEQREYWAGGVFSAFFVSKQSFMESVMGRGLAALEQAITAVSA